MAEEVKPGKETSEWGVTKWVTFVAGTLATVLTALVAALPASGAVDEGSTVVIVLGALAGVCAAIGGVTAKSYVDGRAKVKAAAPK